MQRRWMERPLPRNAFIPADVKKETRVINSFYI